MNTKDKTIKHILYSSIFQHLSFLTFSTPCSFILWESSGIRIPADINVRMTNQGDRLENKYSLWQSFIRFNAYPISLLSSFLRLYLGNNVSVWQDSLKKLIGAISSGLALYLIPYGIIVLPELPWSHVQVLALEKEVLAFIFVSRRVPFFSPFLSLSYLEQDR